MSFEGVPQPLKRNETETESSDFESLKLIKKSSQIYVCCVYCRHMSKTTINIKADKDVKDRAQKLAYELGMPLSVVINAYLKQFIRTGEVHFYTEGQLKNKVKKELNETQKEVLKGRNLSPAFFSAKEMDDYLDKLV